MTKSHPKKVVLIRNAFTHDFGGAERLTVLIAKELELNNLDVAVVSRQPRLLAFAKAQDVRAYRGWWWSKQNWSGKSALLFPVYFAWQALLLVWYLMLFVRLRPAAAHIFSKDDFIAATFAAKILGKRVIWTDPADLKHVFRNHQVWYKNPVGKLTFLASRLANKITLVSNSEKSLIEKSLGHTASANMLVAHIAGKDTMATPVVRSMKDKDAVIFCSTSRLVVDKGIGELIEAFNELSKDSSNYRLWLVGDGNDQEKFKELARDNPFITFVGHTENPLQYVAACDVFVQPTYHEGFSLSLAEAAMLGKPMIATNVGGNPELVNQANGILVPVRDVPMLLSAMKKLGESKALRDQLGKQARIDYKDKFDFSRVVKEKFIPLYEK